MPEVIVSIVNYNGGGFLLSCLKSLDRVKDEAEMEVYVVDNASSDDSIKRAKASFPKFNYIENPENLGFGRANNQVLKKKAKFYLLLNPDSQVRPGVLSYMLAFMNNHPDVGAASCRVEKSNGTLDWASHRGFPTPWVSFLYFFLGNDHLYHVRGRNLTTPHEVDAIVGAFFLTRKEVLDKVGLFDERFFLYGEDLDLCFRIKKAGYKIMYVPEVKIIHLKGISSGIKGHTRELSTATKQARIKAFNSFYSTMILFYKKNLSKSYPFFINWLVYLGICLKWFLSRRKVEV